MMQNNKKHRIYFAFLLLLMGCERPFPLLGSPAHDAMHGVINDGKTVNQITLFNDRNNFRPKLRFEPAIAIEPQTYGWNAPKNPVKIRPGLANKVSFGMDFTTEHKLVPHKTVPEKQILGSVGIVFIASLGSSPAWQAKQKEVQRKIIAKSPISNIKQDWALHEYMIVSGEWVRSYEYFPLDQSFDRDKNDPFRISCGTGALFKDKEHHLSGCAANMLYVPDISITYRFGPQLLPYWREVYQEIQAFTKNTVQR